MTSLAPIKVQMPWVGKILTGNQVHLPSECTSASPWQQKFMVRDQPWKTRGSNHPTLLQAVEPVQERHKLLQTPPASPSLSALHGNSLLPGVTHQLLF